MIPMFPRMHIAQSLSPEEMEWLTEEINVVCREMDCDLGYMPSQGAIEQIADRVLDNLSFDNDIQSNENNEVAQLGFGRRRRRRFRRPLSRTLLINLILRQLLRRRGRPYGYPYGTGFGYGYPYSRLY